MKIRVKRKSHIQYYRLIVKRTLLILLSKNIKLYYEVILFHSMMALSYIFSFYLYDISDRRLFPFNLRFKGDKLRIGQNNFI